MKNILKNFFFLLAFLPAIALADKPTHVIKYPAATPVVPAAEQTPGDPAPGAVDIYGNAQQNINVLYQTPIPVQLNVQLTPVPVLLNSQLTPVPVVQSAGTPTLTNVASSASSVTILSSNSARRGATVQNDSTQVLYVKFGTTASSTSYTIQMAAGSYYEVPFGYTGRIDGIWASANGNARVTEIQ